MNPTGQSQRPGWSAFLALAVFVGLLVGFGYGAWRFLHALGSGPRAAVVTASATVLLSVFSLIYSKSWEQKRAIEEAQRERKRDVYETLMAFWFRIFTATALGENAPTEEEGQRFMAQQAQRLILWASDDFLGEYVRFRAISFDPQANPQESLEVIVGFEKLLYAIRRDLGHSNKGLTTGDLLRVWLNDVDAVLPSPAAQTR